MSGFYDEMMGGMGLVRPHWQTLVESLNQAGPSGLAERWREGQRLIRDNGVTYNVYGDPKKTERPWPLDPVPFLLEGSEWARIESALAQRATLLNRVLQDLYGPQELLKNNRLPAELIFGHPGFLRPCFSPVISASRLSRAATLPSATTTSISKRWAGCCRLT